MQISYIGTGADDFLPGELSRYGEYRRRSAATIDGALQIDLAAGTPIERLHGVREVLYTHSHRDHFDLDTLAALAADRTLTVYLPSDLARRIAAQIPPTVTLVPLSAGDTVETPLGYRVTALAAGHRVSAHPAEVPLHYCVERGGKKVYWGTDGAWITPETWERLLAERPFDRMIIDGTLGDVEGDARVFVHNDLAMVRALATIFRREKLLRRDGCIFVTHISRDSQYPHEALAEKLAPYGIDVAYDDREDIF